MRTIPIDLLNHFRGSVLTVAKCWKLIRLDGLVLGFTDVDIDITILDTTYKAATGMTPSAIQTQSNFGVDNLDVSSVLSDDSITETDIKLGLWDGARIELFEVNYEDLGAGVVNLRWGTLGEVKTGRQTFYSELRGLTQRLQTQVGRIYNPACDANLGDARCGVNVEPLKRTLSITVINSPTSFQVDPDSVADLDDTYYVNGLGTFTTGDNAGFRFEIASYDKTLGRFRSYIQLPYPLAINDEFEVTPGCMKSLGACKRFDNQENFRGFPNIPGPDKLVSGK